MTRGTERIARDLVFDGAGEVRARGRALDWSKTPLGPVDGWTPALRAAVRLELDAPLASCLYVGPEHVLLFNDAFVAALPGVVSPAALGHPAREAARAIGGALEPAVARVMAGGPPSGDGRTRLVVVRDGQTEETRWSPAISAVRDDDGAIVAVRCVLVEATPRDGAQVGSAHDGALHSDEARYRALFQQMDEAYAVVEVLADAEGRWSDFRFLEVNAAFMRHTGMPYPVGKTATALLGRPNPRWALLYGYVAETGEPLRVEEGELALDRIFDLNIFRLGGPGSRRVAVLFTDITARKRIADALAAELAATKALHALSSRALESSTVTGLLEAALDETVAMHHADFGDVQLYDPRTDTLRVVAQRGFAHRFLDRLARVGAHDASTCGRALAEGRRVMLSDVEAEAVDARQSAAARTAGYRAVQSTPIVSAGGEPLGVLSTYFRAPRRFAESEERLTDLFAREIARTIERAQTQATLRESEQRTRWQNETLRSVVDGAPLQASLAILSRLTTAETGGAARTAFYLVSTDGTRLHPVRGAGTMDAGYLDLVDGFPIGEDSLACGLAVPTGQPVITPDVLAEPRWSTWAHAASEYDYRACWSFPIKTRDHRAVGTFAMYFRAPRDVTPRERSLAEAVTQTASVVIASHDAVEERARAEAALRESEEKYRSLFEAMDEGFALCELVRDGEGRAIDYRYVELNPALARHGGVAREALTGRRAREVFPDLDPWLLETYARVVAEQVSVHAEHPFRHVGLWLRINAFPRGGDRFAVIFEDITERRLAAERLRQDEERNALLLSLSDTLRPLADASAIKAAAARVVGERLGVERAQFVEVEGGGDVWLAEASDCKDLPPLVGRRAGADFGRFLTDGLVAGRAVTVDDVQTDPRIAGEQRAAWAAAGVRAGASVPLVKRGVLVAALWLERTEPHRWTESELDLARDAAERTWDALERARVAAALRASESRYRTLLENVRDYAIYLLDAKGLVTEWTSGAARVKGYAAEDVLGRSVALFYPPEEVAAGLVERELAEAAETGRAEREGWRVRKDGSRFWADEIATAIRDSDGTLRGFTKITRDLSERRRLQEQSEQLLAAETVARRQAEEANRGKDEFLATLSHELRTPLAPILLWTEALRAGKVALAELPRAFDAILQSAGSQARLIENLLDLSRLQFGKAQLERRATRVTSVVESAAEMVQPTASAKGVVFVVDARGLSEATALLDAGRLQQVLWNLLSNAVKFTPRGGRVELRVRREEQQLVVEVGDTGQGIEADFLPFVFDRFRQADMREERSHGGLGIGLALSLSIVELHGGSIEARSGGLGAGALFTVRIPWIDGAADAELPERPAEAPSASPALVGLRVLLVEDDPQTREAMRWVLERAGATVIAVGSGREALAACGIADGDRVPDVMVCDIGLPEMSGYELIPNVIALRRSRGHRPIAACAVSAHARKEDQLRAIDAGFDTYLTKPVSAARLLEAVEELAAVAAHRFE